jgi:hypothetical protein
MDSLYFIYTLPSFTMSVENLKFLEPHQYIQTLSEEDWSLLSSFGAPKIEMELPLVTDILVSQTNPVMFKLRGMCSTMKINQIVDAAVHGRYMRFTIIGNPYNGIFKVNMVFNSLISRDINKNLASIQGSFEKNHLITEIQTYLNEAIKEWYNKGLTYI